MDIGRRELIKTAFASACLRALGATAFGAATTPVEAYVQRADKLVAQHRRNVGRLKAPAELVAEALIAGGALKLGGSEAAFIGEGSGRSGGIMNIGQVSPTKPAHPGDIAWLSYAADSYDAQLKAGAELESQKCLVMAFGPLPTSGVPGFKHWIDSMTPWNADQNFTLLGNVLSLWTFTGEVAAATARRGKTIVFWMSVGYPTLTHHPEFQGRNERYMGRMFHKGGEPQMKPLQAGVAAGAYLDSIGKTLHDIQAQELGKIVSVGNELGRRPASHPALYMAVTHMMTGDVLGDRKWFKEFKGNDEQLTAALDSDGYLIWMGYYDGVPPDKWEAVRRAKARAAWIVVPLPGQKYNFEQYGDVFINQHYDPGDAVVQMPGYDVRILPAMGIAELFIWEVMRRAAGSSS